MLRAILNKPGRQHPTRHQLYSHLPAVTKTIQVRRTRHAGHCWSGEARTNSSVMYSYGHQHMAKQKQDDQLEHIYSSYVSIRDVALKTCQKRWMIRRSGERWSGISVLGTPHDDDDDYFYSVICYYFYRIRITSKQTFWHLNRILTLLPFLVWVDLGVMEKKGHLILPRNVGLESKLSRFNFL